MTTLSVKDTIAVNSRRFTWKYWVLLAAWEPLAILTAYALYAAATPIDGAFIGWTLVAVLGPLLPLVIPAKALQAIGKVVGLGLILFYGGLMLFGVGGYIAVWLAQESSWAYKWRYALADDMKGAVVILGRKPHDCDFMTAPMGAKHCHYERQISTVRVRTSNGQQMVSHDDGRTWAPSDGSMQPAVWVSWQRVED